jgi:hypothetical protein
MPRRNIELLCTPSTRFRVAKVDGHVCRSGTHHTQGSYVQISGAARYSDPDAISETDLHVCELRGHSFGRAF